jgi:hypothetical protein
VSAAPVPVWRRWPARRRTITPAVSAWPGLDPADVAEIGARLAAIDGGKPPLGLQLRLRPLVDKSVPLRHIAATSYVRTCRVRFADGTTVLARGARPGDVAVLAAAMRSRSLPPLACRTDLDGTHLVFAGLRRSTTLSLVVTGMDQAD